MLQIAIRSRPVYDIDRSPTLLESAPGLPSSFRRWLGKSGRRYTVSTYPIADCPDYVDAVAIAVEAASGLCVWIGETGDGGPHLRHCLAAAAWAGADEVHVHLLADSPKARRAAVRDLDGRH